jgi:glycosyltransferase involved in cell wall biosynthesis
MAKILFYNHTGQVGGAERLLLTLLQRLDQSQFTPVLVCPAQGQLHQLASEAGVRTEAIDGLKARFTWRLDYLIRYLNSFRQVIRDLRRKVIDTQPDLIHANSVRAGLVATMATFGLKQTVIWHIHDLLPRHPFNTLIRLIASLSRRTRILAVAQASADRLVGDRAGLRRRVTVIPNAVDFDKYCTNSGARERIRQEVQAEADDPVIGMIGRLTPAKGQLELLKLFPTILSRFPKARLLIVGEPAFNNEHEYRQLLSQTIMELNISDQVQMLGSRDDIPDILQALDLLVVNSASEACSLVILEAMASGTPVLATSTGGTPEIIKHQENGLLVQFGDNDGLAREVTAILNDREARGRLGSQGRRDAHARYSICRFMAEMHSFYGALLAESKIPQEKNLTNFEVTFTSD